MILAHVSDFHIRKDYKDDCNKKIEQILTCINRLKVNVLVYTGDIIDYRYINKLPENEKENAIIDSYNYASTIFLKLRACVDKLVICPGNHDAVKCDIFETDKCEKSTIDENSAYYKTIFKYYNEFCIKTFGSSELYKTRLETYDYNGSIYRFIISNTNWPIKNIYSKSSDACINCFNVYDLLRNIREDDGALNIFVSHLPLDYICECGKYNYTSDTHGIIDEINRKCSICLAGDKHTLSEFNNNYIIGSPLNNEQIEMSIHLFNNNSYEYKIVQISNNYYQIIEDEKNTKKVYELCNKYLSKRLNKMLFGSNNTLDFFEIMRRLEIGDNNIKLIEEIYDKITNIKIPTHSSEPFSFEFISQLIESNPSRNHNVFNFKGEHESGKSSLLSILFVFLLYKHLYFSYKYLPFYFNVEYFRKNNKTSSEIFKRFKKFLSEASKLCQLINKPACYIIDGLNQYCLFGDDPDLGALISAEIRTIINDNDSLCIISLDTYSDVLDFTKSEFDNSAWKNSSYLMYFDKIQAIPENEEKLKSILLNIFKIYLPKEYDKEKNYNKQTILNIILIHDLGECYVGDCSPYMEKYEQNKIEEDKFMRRLFSSWANLNNVDFTEEMVLWDMWKKGDAKNINYKIAYELDKLQLLYQLKKIEKPEQFFTRNRIEDLANIKNEIETPLVKEIYKIIIEENENITMFDYLKSLENEINNDNC